jgi:hypothetical protein
MRQQRQIVRAILFASATTATFSGRRERNLSSHTAHCFACLITARLVNIEHNRQNCCTLRIFWRKRIRQWYRI